MHYGETLGFLGPKGSGNTTTIECIEGYKRPVTALSLDPCKDDHELKELIGIMLQEPSLYLDLRLGELLWLSPFHTGVEVAPLFEQPLPLVLPTG